MEQSDRISHCPRCGSRELADLPSERQRLGRVKACQNCRLKGSLADFMPIYSLTPTYREVVEHVAELIYRGKDNPRWTAQLLTRYYSEIIIPS